MSGASIVDPETPWQVLVVGRSPHVDAALELTPADPSGSAWRCRGRSLELTRIPAQLEALASIEPQRFHLAIVGSSVESSGPVLVSLCRALRGASPALRILWARAPVTPAPGDAADSRAGSLHDDPMLEALDLDVCPTEDAPALRAMIRAALRHADDVVSLEAARAEILRQMTLRERLEGIATMITGITHDVSTPLGVACTAGSVVDETAERLLAVERLDEELRAELQEDLRDAVDILNRSLDRAHRLIDSFKQFSASQFSNERARVRLSDVVDDCVMVLRSELRRAHIALAVHAPDEDLIWDGFPGHLGRVVVNLLQNTMRYAFEAGQGGKVSIYIDRSTEDDGFVIQYIDDGRGIEAHVLPRIFDAFFTTGRTTGGTGLGLAISHNIVVNLLGGTIRCDSTPGHGASFTITLPAVATGDSGLYSSGLAPVMPSTKRPSA